MTPQMTLKTIRNSEAEEQFFASLASRADPRLPLWAMNYHFFSVHQARLLAAVVATVDPTDSESLAEVTKALYEEFGSGNARDAHSRLFARFCQAAGVDTQRLPLRRTDVLLPIIDYLREIESAYRSGAMATVLGAYAFLERSAVLSYPLMLSTLQKLGFAAEALVFFTTHIEQEAAHEKGAFSMVARLISTPETAAFVAQLHLMERRWDAFWKAFQ